MLKYQDFIDNLTIEQKLSLLADFSSLGGTDSGALDVHFLAETSVTEMNINTLNGEIFPTFAGLVNSWDGSLISKVADVLCTFKSSPSKRENDALFGRIHRRSRAFRSYDFFVRFVGKYVGC